MLKHPEPAGPAGTEIRKDLPRPQSPLAELASSVKIPLEIKLALVLSGKNQGLPLQDEAKLSEIIEKLANILVSGKQEPLDKTGPGPQQAKVGTNLEQAMKPLLDKLPQEEKNIILRFVSDKTTNWVEKAAEILKTPDKVPVPANLSALKEMLAAVVKKLEPEDQPPPVASKETPAGFPDKADEGGDASKLVPNTSKNPLPGLPPGTSKSGQAVLEETGTQKGLTVKSTDATQGGAESVQTEKPAVKPAAGPGKPPADTLEKHPDAMSGFRPHHKGNSTEQPHLKENLSGTPESPVPGKDPQTRANEFSKPTENPAAGKGVSLTGDTVSAETGDLSPAEPADPLKKVPVNHEPAQVKGTEGDMAARTRNAASSPWITRSLAPESSETLSARAPERGMEQLFKRTDTAVDRKTVIFDGETAESLSIVEKLKELVSNVSLKSGQAFDDRTVRSLVKDSGLMWESKLKEFVAALGDKKTAVTPEMTSKLIEGDAKALALKHAEISEGGGARDVAASLKSFTESLEKMQVLNSHSSDDAGRYLLPLPYIQSGQMRFGQLLIDLDRKKEGKNDGKDRIIRVAFLLDMSLLGPVQAGISIYKKSLSGEFQVGSGEAKEMIDEAIPGLVSLLSEKGYGVKKLECRLVSKDELKNVNLAEKLASPGDGSLNIRI
jgi:hypothetical protein